MCTSFTVNRRKTLVGWNLDMAGIPYRVRRIPGAVLIEAEDAKEGWLPLFGANARGDFVGMPTCWPYDSRSDPGEDSLNLLLLDIDLLLGKRTFEEIRALAETGRIRSVPGFTFMGSLTDANGNVLHIVPGQGQEYLEKPPCAILTNFSPYADPTLTHPLMGRDRYAAAEKILRSAPDTFDVRDCFGVLREVAMENPPTVVSMVFDVTCRTVYWCMEQRWDSVEKAVLSAENP